MQNVEKFPKLCRQCKGSSEYAFITDGARRVYLKDGNGNPALFGTPQANEAYHRLLAEKAANQAAPPKSGSITLDEVCLRFLKAKQYLSPQHYGNYRRVIDAMLAIYSGKPAVDFGVAQLKTVRQEFVNQGLCRNVGSVPNLLFGGLGYLEKIAPKTISYGKNKCILLFNARYKEQQYFENNNFMTLPKTRLTVSNVRRLAKR